MVLLQRGPIGLHHRSVQGHAVVLLQPAEQGHDELHGPAEAGRQDHHSLGELNWGGIL